MGEIKKEHAVTILIFEGPDKVGKSSLIYEINRRTGYEYLCIDRFTASAWVYDRQSGRRERQEELVASERELSQLRMTKVVNIVLKCDRDVLRQRILAEDEEATDRISALDPAIRLYDEYASHVSLLPVIEIDTTGKSIDDTVEELLQKVGEL